jgi:hypothetical protein
MASTKAPESAAAPRRHSPEHFKFGKNKAFRERDASESYNRGISQQDSREYALARPEAIHYPSGDKSEDGPDD